jgi:hypothetical protein
MDAESSAALTGAGVGLLGALVALIRERVRYRRALRRRLEQRNKRCAPLTSSIPPMRGRDG